VVVPPPPITVSAITGAHDVCPGDNIQLRVTASGGPPNGTLAYQWSVNNAPVAGGTEPVFNLPTTTGSGNKAVRVTVSEGNLSASSGPVNVLVRTLGPPTIQFNVSPTTINYGDRLPLNAADTVSECATATPIRYTASQGTITGNTFDSSGVSFDPNSTGAQSVVVRLSATETDSINQTVSANANVTVNKKAVASRQDIVFANRSARVNNAAKRYLIEQLTPKLRADPGSTVILIGHRDMSETGRAFAKLDTERLISTAAVMSAGKGICPSLDLSRVQMSEAGTDQTDPPMPFADASVKERTGQTATDNRAQFRRVEVWFIPSGADMPNVPSFKNVTDEVLAKGCPR
jgi:outer membrane protein OmpA-like peptidoglycan-associated protein